MSRSTKVVLAVIGVFFYLVLGWNMGKVKWDL